MLKVNKKTLLVSLTIVGLLISVIPEGMALIVTNTGIYGSPFYQTCAGAVNPITNKIYLPNPDGSRQATVSVVDCSTNTVVATVPVGIYPVSIAVNPMTNKIYVVNQGSNSVSVIDGSTNTVIKTLSWSGDRTYMDTVIQIGEKPDYVAVNSETNRIYVVNNWFGTVSVIDGTSDTVVDAICWGPGRNVENYAWCIYINPETNLGYVTFAAPALPPNTPGTPWDKIVSVIDLTTNQETTRLYGHRGKIAINPETNRIYLCDGSLFEIDGTTNTYLNTIDAGGNVAAVGVNPRTNRVYVTLTDSNNQNLMAVIDGSTGSVVDSLSMGQYQWQSIGSELAVNPETNKIYTTSMSQLLVYSDDGVASHDLVLNAGWNMVSFPILPADTSFASIFSGKGYYQVLTWSGTSYVTPSDVEAGKGYWILVLSDTTISIEGNPVNSYSSDLPAGWSMIGSVNGGVVNCASVFLGYYQMLTWTGTSYTTATTIEPGKGYWALVLTPTHITIG
jgi:YVTN family beta-propeller protein